MRCLLVVGISVVLLFFLFGGLDDGGEKANGGRGRGLGLR